MKTKIILCALLCVTYLCFYAASGAVRLDTPKSDFRQEGPPWFIDNIPAALNWVRDDNPANLCHGRFTEPVSISRVPHPPKITTTDTTITSRGAAHIEFQGVSLIQDHVVVKQHGRTLKADKAHLYRNKQGRLEWIELEGHLNVQEHDRHFLATRAWLNVKKDISYAKNLLYRAYTYFNPQHKYYNAWGRADYAKKVKNRWWNFYHATYTTCSPTDPVWVLHAKKLVLDTDKSVGKAYHAYLTIKNIPVFYSPYLWFPLDARRRTGFLYPTFGHDNEQGYFFTIPWYWNIAPNYDWLITPRLMSKRGVLFENNFRYLTLNGSGHIKFDINPHDAEFSRYKDSILSSNYPAQYDPYVNALRGDHSSRYFLQIDDFRKWSRRWDSNLHINYVSDDYYPADYVDVGGDINQLFNQFAVNYNGLNWNFTGILQAYQTLHTFDGQSTDFNQDQYRRLPELDLNADYPNLIDGINLTLNAQMVDFMYDSNFSLQKPTGQRLHLQPGLNKSFNWSYGYILPSVFLNYTQYYSIKHFVNDRMVSPSYTVPIFSLDNGLYFNRFFHRGGAQYIQTLEPRLFYLYAPYVKQDHIPDFDTYLLPFTFDQLFSLNRFTGYDRQSNANQVSLSLTSRILSAQDASTRLSFGLGVLYYFTPLKVSSDLKNMNLIYGSRIRNNKWSPIVTNLTYYPSNTWSTTLDMAWDTEKNQLNNGTIALRYSRDGRHIFTTGYSYVYDGTSDAQGLTNSTNLFYLGSSWPLTHRISALAYLYYDFSKRLSRDITLGVQYDACCWAIRLVGQRTYIGDELQNNDSYHRQFKTGVFVQVLLKGLGVFGSNNLGTQLAGKIPGYADDFI